MTARPSPRLGWVPKAATRETTYDHLNHHVPAELKYDLHCLLVEHGKVCRHRKVVACDKILKVSKAGRVTRTPRCRSSRTSWAACAWPAAAAGEPR